MKRFKVVDVYEGHDVLGYVEGLDDVFELMNERVEDTDGECCIQLRTLDAETKKYKFTEIIYSC